MTPNWPTGRRVVESVAANEVIEAREVIVLGDVHGRVLAQGGGAQVVVLGDVHPGAEVGAVGGAARVVVLGRIR